MMRRSEKHIVDLYYDALSSRTAYAGALFLLYSGYSRRRISPRERFHKTISFVKNTAHTGLATFKIIHRNIVGDR